MITYNEQKTKDDRLFLNHAREALGEVEFSLVMDDARKAYQSQSRPSEAKRAANLVILAALKEIGQEHWRPTKDNEPKAERIQVKPAALPERKVKKKWDGKSILDMADENKLKKQTGSNKI